MRTTVVIAKRGAGYISTITGKFGGGHRGVRCGLTPYDAALAAARYMVEYAQSNPDGGDLMAPPEVLDLVPEHLRTIGNQQSDASDKASPNPAPAEIRSAREAAGLTQSEAAALIHCTLRGWQEWEAGNRRMHPGLWELFRVKIKQTP